MEVFACFFSITEDLFKEFFNVLNEKCFNYAVLVDDKAMRVFFETVGITYLIIDDNFKVDLIRFIFALRLILW